MSVRYVPIRFNEIRNLLEDQMGFSRNDGNGCREMIWTRQVVTNSGIQYPYMIKVFSTIDIHTGVSRESGSDAIRLVLIDTDTGRVVKRVNKRVFRTKNALSNIHKRARELFRLVLEGPHCPECSSLMAVRESQRGKFWGCTRFAMKGPHRCYGTRKF